MAEEEQQVEKNKRIRPREQARGQKEMLIRKLDNPIALCRKN